MKKYLSLVIGVLFYLSFQPVFAGAPTWERVNYTNTTTFLGEIVINDFNSLYQTNIPAVAALDYIGAFVNGECRMVAQIIENDGKFYISSLIHGGDMESMLPGGAPIPEDEIEFRLWDESSNTEYVLLGTTFFNQTGEIGSSTNLFEIGKPNAGKDLKSLTVTGVTLSPAFSTSVVDYVVTVPAGGGLPALADYVTAVADSRATVTVSPATDLNSGNKTTITVKAEDGTTKVYTITFNEATCNVGNVTVSGGGAVCSSAAIPELKVTSTVVGTVRWYTTQDGTTPIANGLTYTPSSKSVTLYVAEFNICEGPRTAVSVSEVTVPAITISGAKNVCSDATAPLLSVTGATGTVKWFESAPATPAIGGTIGNTYTHSSNSAGSKAVWAIQEISSCQSAAATASYVVDQKPTPIITLVSEIFQDEAPSTITVSPTGGTLSGSGVVGATFDPSKVALGEHTVSYSVENGTCSASTSTKITVKEKVIVTLSYIEINSKLTTALDLIKNSDVGTAVGNYPASAVDELQAAYDVALVKKSAATTQGELDAAATALQTAIDNFNSKKVPDVITGISINEISSNLKIGDKFTPTVTFYPAGVTPKTLTWSSANDAIATVSNGVITAIGEGTVEVSVSYLTFTDAITIKVFPDVVPLNYDQLNANISTATTIVTAALPAGTAVGQYPQSAIDALNSAIDKAEAVKENATLQSQIDDAAKELAEAIAAFKLLVVADVVTGIQITSGDKTLEVDATHTPSVSMTPSGVTPAIITWTSSNSAVATISTNGLVTAVAKGSATIKAQIVVGGKIYSDEIIVTVTVPAVPTTDYVSIDVSSENEIKLALSEVASSITGSASDFTIKINGETVPVLTTKYIESVDGKNIIIKIIGVINPNDVVTVSYVNNGKITTVSGKELSSFSSVSATNTLTGLDEVEALVAVTVNGKTITAKSESIIKSIAITTIDGALIQNLKTNSNVVFIELDAVSVGTYVIIIESENGLSTKKVVLK
ncbi:MAG: Ig-like domain-containing protein [Bacteroidales bacterium]|nr:Ig-like domain-containing protein [Bacteroidales bacterium]